jgi:hypothetical protein
VKDVQGRKFLSLLVRRFTAFCFALVCVSVITARAATITVSNTNDSGPVSLRDALARAADGDTIDASSVTGTITLTSGELLITNSVNVIGPDPNLLAINGNGRSSIFLIAPSNTVTISSLTLTNGGASAIYNESGRLIVTNCIFTGNFAGFAGGAICNQTGTLTVNDCILRGNFAANGGGGGIANNARNNLNATALILNSIFTNNVAEGNGGGAIYNTAFGGTANVQVLSCILIRNGAPNGPGGGGIVNVARAGSATAKIMNCTLDRNGPSRLFMNSRYGGAIQNVGLSDGNVDFEVHNSTLVSNSAMFGGSIYNEGYFGTATVRVVNSTFSGNSSSSRLGGAIHNRGDNGPTTIKISSSTLSGNSLTNASSIYSFGSRGTVQIGNTIIDSRGLGQSISNDLDAAFISLLILV